MDSFCRLCRGVLGSTATLVALVVAAIWLTTPAEPPKPNGSTDSEPSVSATPVDSRSPQPGSGSIRIALVRKPVSRAGLRFDGPCIVTDLADGSTAEIASGDAVASVEDGRVSLRGADFDDAEIMPVRSPGIWVEDRLYRGSVRLHVSGEGRMWVVNVLPLEDYVAAVVDAEMPAAFPPAAREAQAIAARTYAVSFLTDPPRHERFDLFATPVSQNYLGVIYRSSDGRKLAGETAAGRAAAAATAGVVCTDSGRVFRTYYSACCGGGTSDGRRVFGDPCRCLSAVPCDGCRDAPLHRWNRTDPTPASIAALTRLARRRDAEFAVVQAVKPATAPSAARSSVVVSDGRRTVTLATAAVRSAVAVELPSADFTLAVDGQAVSFRGRGHGHGVGLCQWGARSLAAHGASAEAILRHYYPGCELRRLDDVARDRRRPDRQPQETTARSSRQARSTTSATSSRPGGQADTTGRA